MKKNDIVEVKKEFRKKYQEKRNELTQEQCREAGHNIAEKVISMNPVQKAGTVFLYAACKNEVPTKELMEKLLSMGKRVAFPKVNGSNLEFYEIKNWEELKPGYQEILEPDIREKSGEVRTEIIPEDNDVLIVPGIVFNKNGERLGYGGGFYDRYLTRIKTEQGRRPFRVGICYRIQLHSGNLPMDEQDRRMDCVVTEQYSYQSEEPAEASAFTKAQIWGKTGEVLGKIIGGLLKG